MRDIYYRTAENFADLLDNRFELFGIRFGLDPLINLIPGLGDVIGAIFGLYLIFVAKRIGLPRENMNKMVVNLVVDFFIGIIPVFGVIGDVFYKSNLRNWRIIKNHVNNVEEYGDIVEGEIVS